MTQASTAAASPRRRAAYRLLVARFGDERSAADWPSRVAGAWGRSRAARADFPARLRDSTHRMRTNLP